AGCSWHQAIPRRRERPPPRDGLTRRRRSCRTETARPEEHSLPNGHTRSGRAAQPAQHELRDAPERLEHAGASESVAGLEGHAAKIEDVVELSDVHDELARKILLVVLDDEWNVARVNALLGEIGVQVLHALDVLLDLAPLAVGDEHDPVCTLQHELSCRGVVYLPRHRVELQAGREARDRSEIERKEIE